MYSMEPDAMDQGTAKAIDKQRSGAAVERVQTGIRIERRMLKVLKALAEYKDMTLGDLIEGIVLHVFEGKLPFEAGTLKDIAELKRIYGLDLSAASSHRLEEALAEAGR